MLIFYLGAKMQFENLVLGNLEIILDRIGLSNVRSSMPALISGPYRAQARMPNRPPAPHEAITLCIRGQVSPSDR